MTTESVTGRSHRPTSRRGQLPRQDSRRNVVRTPWWGNLLRWQRHPDTDVHSTTIGGQTHYIVKVNRAYAKSRGLAGDGGWYVWRADRQGTRGEFGAFLGATRQQAHMLAEAFFISGGDTMAGGRIGQSAFPSLAELLTNGTTPWLSRAYLTADERAGRLNIGSNGAEYNIGYVRPEFTTAGAVEVAWYLGRGGVEVGPFTSWPAVFEHLHEQLAGGQARPGAHRGF